MVVADYPHPPSGAAMVQRLDRLGIPIYYRLATDLSHIMSKVNLLVLFLFIFGEMEMQRIV